jgi:hypothetical protein
MENETPILSLIEDNRIILDDNSSEYMSLINSSKLEDFSEQWKYNRILSNDKIESICNIIKDKTTLDTVLHFFYVNDNGVEKLICFDGNHRREALILLYKKNNLNIKVCCYIYIYKCQVINNVDKEIVDKFRIINQMTPIPDIYNEIIDNLDNNKILIDKKNIIENVFNLYKNKYDKFYSEKSKCRKPNFNETTFKDLCNEFKFKNKEELINYLEKYNLDKKKKIYNTSLSETTIAKCKIQNFYMFT